MSDVRDAVAGKGMKARRLIYKIVFFVWAVESDIQAWLWPDKAFCGMMEHWLDRRKVMSMGFSEEEICNVCKGKRWL